VGWQTIAPQASNTPAYEDRLVLFLSLSRFSQPMRAYRIVIGYLIFSIFCRLAQFEIDETLQRRNYLVKDKHLDLIIKH